MTDKKQDLVDRYIRGEMNSMEEASFKSMLESDEELKEMYLYTSKVCQAIKDRNEKLEKINRWKYEIRKKRFHSTITGKVVYSFVCIAAIIVFVFLIRSNPSMPELDTQKYECYRGTSGITHVVELINEKQYDKALYVIENTERSCVAGIDSIKEVMHNVSENHKPRMNYEISVLRLDYNEMRWLKVYALIGLDRNDEAKHLLEEISKENSMYSVKADSILNEMY